jgi:beta-galactosidase/beta-glucuronidase
LDISLNGTWAFFIDEKDDGLSESWYSLKWINSHMKEGIKIEVPSNYNTLPGLEKYLGVVWYLTELPPIPSYSGTHDFYLEVEGSNYITDVWLNGTFLGQHEGGFTPFRFPFSFDLLSRMDSNYVAIRVDTRLKADGIPSAVFDWYNWGGIHRNVQVVVLDRCRIRTIEVVTKVPEPHPEQVTVQVEYSLKNFQEYLDRCFTEGEEPRVDYEVYYLGRFFDGEQHMNKILIQSGSRYIEPDKNLDPAVEKPLSRDQNDLESYFSDSLTSNEPKVESSGDLTDFFSHIKTENLDEDEEPSEDKNSLFSRYYLPKIFQKTQKFPRMAANIGFKDRFELTLHNPLLWTPNTPELYAINFYLHGVEEDKTIRFGIREISVKHTSILLNHEPIKLKGINLHEELLPYGRHYPASERRKEIQHMKKIGFNALRTAHYSHDESLISIADEEGLLILEEIPVYWNVDFQNPRFRLKAARMLKELIQRDFNHPSVIQWSIANEIPVEQYSCRRQTELLLQYVKKLDPTRLVTYVSNRFFDWHRRNCETNCLNCYFGWYYMTVYQLNFFLDAMYTTHQNTPWIITEFGADGKFGVLDPNIKHSETNQARIIDYSIKLFNSKPYIAGWFIWVYRDFRSPMRLNAYQQGFNRKGIVDEQNRPKLIARVLKRTINQKLLNVRMYERFPVFFSFIAHFLEELIMNFGKLVDKFNSNQIKTQYSSVWEKKI